MDIDIFTLLIVALFVLGGLVIVKAIALAAFAIGFEPPAWFISIPLFGVPSRTMAGFFALWFLGLTIIFVVMIVEIPFFQPTLAPVDSAS